MRDFAIQPAELSVQVAPVLLSGRVFRGARGPHTVGGALVLCVLSALHFSLPQPNPTVFLFLAARGLAYLVGSSKAEGIAITSKSFTVAYRGASAEGVAPAARCWPFTAVINVCLCSSNWFILSPV